MKKFIAQKFVFAVCLLAPLHVLHGQSSDHMFPQAGHIALTGSTGIPFIAIGEVAIGISDRFAVGIIGGTTPVVEGYGLRIRGVVYQNDAQTFKVFARAPILYYPETADLGGEPWYLTHPVVAGEWKLESGIRIQASAGIVAAACAFSLYDKLGIETDHEEEEMGEMGFEGGLWNTFGTGVAVPVSKQITLHSEIHAVMEGLKLSSSDSWVGGPPVVFTMAITYNF